MLIDRIKILAVLLSLTISGCTVIGYGIGHKLDSSKRQVKVYKYPDYMDLRRGSYLTLVLKNDEYVSGELVNIDGEKNRLVLKVKGEIKTFLVQKIHLVYYKGKGSRTSGWVKFGLFLDVVAIIVGTVAAYMTLRIIAGGE